MRTEMELAREGMIMENTEPVSVGQNPATGESWAIGAVNVPDTLGMNEDERDLYAVAYKNQKVRFCGDIGDKRGAWNQLKATLVERRCRIVTLMRLAQDTAVLNKLPEYQQTKDLDMKKCNPPSDRPYDPLS